MTHAGIYGIDVSKDTLAMLYQTDIDYYFRVNFGGFEKLLIHLVVLLLYQIIPLIQRM